MKNYLITALIITICTLPFSCKKKDVNPTPTPPPMYATVVFWTNNSAKLTSCASAILIRVNGGSSWGSFHQGTATITTLNASAPSGCVVASVGNLSPGVQYLYQPDACATGGTAIPWVYFYVLPGECLKIEIS